MDRNLKPVTTLRPFTRMCVSIGALPSSYLMSMTYEEQLLWLCNYLQNTIIPAFNNNGLAIEELQNKYIELKNYIDNYFENLDVQEEINNKLDEMAESGELTDIIAQYLGLAGILAYNTKANLKEAQNIANGSICKTLGDLEYNDGKGNFYKIRPITSGDIVDNDNILALEVSDILIAEKIPDYNIEQINGEISDINEEINNINDEISDINGELDELKEEKNEQLSDSCQTSLYKELTGLFDYDLGWALSSCLIIENKGIAVANDWTEGGSGGTKFNIVTFDYTSETISNIVTQHELVTGHANSMCKIDNNHILIAGIDKSYIYNLTTNTYVETDVVNGLSACADYNGDIYGSVPSQNKLYKLIYENDELSVEEEYTINGLYATLSYGGQGMVIYDNKIIYPGHTPICLVILDLATKEIIKNQLITAPNNSEYEDGFVYNNELILCDAVGNLFKPDIYSKRNIGGYSGFIITKSLTDIVLYNEPKRLNNNDDNIISFEKHMSFLNANSNTDIGTIGSQFESLTLYLGHGSAGSTKMHELTPCEITCFKSITNMGLKNNVNNNVTSYDCKFNGSYYNIYNNKLEKYTISGIVTFGGGDSVPNINIRLNKFVEYMNINDGTISVIDMTSSDQNIYLVKIVGHKKVGYGY